MLIEVHTEGAVRNRYLAIDSSIAGAAHGGLRIAEDVTAELLVAAARTMTLKYGWAGLPVGGAKAGLLMPPDTTALDRAMKLRDFGMAIKPYLRTRAYVPGEDMGTTKEDVRAVLAAAGVRPKPGSLMFTASGTYTGIGLCAAAMAVASSLDLPIKGLRVTIEGFGNVGAAAARRFHNAGVKVLAVSTVKGAVYNEKGLDVPALLSLRRRYGEDAVLRPDAGDKLPVQELAAIESDVLCPCAIMHSITADNVRSIKARIICPGANVPATDDAEELLNERQVVVIPDFVANCGGVLGSSMSRAGLGRDEVSRMVHRRLYKQTSLLIVDAHEQRRTLRDVATEVALQRFEEQKADYEQKSPVKSFTRFAVGIYRSGIIPRPLLAPLGRRYYEEWERRHGLL